MLHLALHQFFHFFLVIQTEDINSDSGLPHYQVLNKDEVVLIQEVADDVEENMEQAVTDQEHVQRVLGLASAEESESEVTTLPKRSTRVKTRKNAK